MGNPMMAHSGMLFLALVLIVLARQQLFVFPHLRRELKKRNKLRGGLVRMALGNSPAATWNEPKVGPGYSFDAWVALNADGTVSIGGELLSPSEPFQVTARDAHHIPRAVAI